MLGSNTGYELLVKISSDISGLQNGLEQASSKIGSFGRSIGAIGKNMTLIGTGISTAILGTFKSFSDYEEKLVDMAKVTDQSYEDIEKSIGQIDPVLGNMTELMSGYYQVISAGVTEPIEALGLLTVAAETAKAAHLESSEVVKALTKLMAGYGDEIGNVSDAADLLFGMEKVGQTNVAELTPLIGGLATLSNQLGISASEMGGAVALITRTAGSTAEAATMYEGIMSGMLKPTADMTEAFNTIGESVRGVGEGYSSASEMLKDLGFIESMKKLQEYCETTGITLGDLFGRKEAMVGFMALADDSFKTLEGTVQDVSESTGSAKEAFDEWSETGKAAMDELKSSLSNISITFGETFAPMITGIIGKINEFLPKIKEWVESNKPLIEGIGKLAGVLVVGGPILIGLGMLATAFQTLLSPIGLVVLAVAGLATAWATDFGGIQEKTKAVIEYVKGLFTGFITFITDIKDKIIAVIDEIKDAISEVGKLKIGNVDVHGSINQATGNLPSHASGIDYVPQTGLALLHQGEAVLNPAENKAYQSGKSGISLNIENITVGDNADEGSIREMFEEMFREVATEFKRTGEVMA